MRKVTSNGQPIRRLYDLCLEVLIIHSNELLRSIGQGLLDISTIDVTGLT